MEPLKSDLLLLGERERAAAREQEVTEFHAGLDKVILKSKPAGHLGASMRGKHEAGSPSSPQAGKRRRLKIKSQKAARKRNRRA